MSANACLKSDNRGLRSRKESPLTATNIISNARDESALATAAPTAPNLGPKRSRPISPTHRAIACVTAIRIPRPSAASVNDRTYETIIADEPIVQTIAGMTAPEYSDPKMTGIPTNTARIAGRSTLADVATARRAAVARAARIFPAIFARATLGKCRAPTA